MGEINIWIIYQINFAMIKNIRQGVLQKQIFSSCPGACILTSIYNAIPALYKYNYNKVKQVYNELDLHERYDIDKICDIINRKYGGNLLIMHGANDIYLDRQLKIERKQMIEECLDDQLLVVFGIQYINYNGTYGGHVITLFGYDRKFYYAYDNTLDGNRIVYLIIEQILNNANVFKNDQVINNLRVAKTKNQQLIQDELLDYLTKNHLVYNFDKDYIGFDKNLIYGLFIVAINRKELDKLNEKLKQDKLNTSMRSKLQYSGKLCFDDGPNARNIKRK